MERNEKTMRQRERMAGIRHHLFGNVVVDIVPGTVFNPLTGFYDPGFFNSLLAWFRYRAARAGVGSGLPKALRESALDEAAQRGIRLFTNRDYAKEGITADERTRAILSTARRMDRSLWKDDGEGWQRERTKRKWTPYNRAMASRTVSPDRIVQAAHGSREDIDTLTGTGTDELKTGIVSVPGGHGRPHSDGQMVRDERGYRMDRRYGFDQKYPPCTVARTVDGRITDRHVPTPTPTDVIPADDIHWNGYGWRGGNAVYDGAVKVG